MDDTLECRACLVLHEQLDIERAINERLLNKLLGSEYTESDHVQDESESEFEKLSTPNNWNKQKLRLMKRAQRDFENYVREQRDAVKSVGE